MNTVAEIKQSAGQLPLPERQELFRWLATQDDILGGERDELLNDLDVGLSQADRGELISGPSAIKSLRDRLRPSR
ncbi:hypothetical protein OpiT1DRAFT_02331 [Opitutaceae bacterium TAV1]|nr:hypothetical protein OPIT5_14855 [Opitutaceae bacterium TAV5]EIP97881.1 hypothetical protein OpiT1DRAFT_02331 [Opitutaceae bacterium TAV1]